MFARRSSQSSGFQDSSDFQQLLQPVAVEAYYYFAVDYRDRRCHAAELFQFGQC